MAGKIKKKTAGPSPDPERARLQEQTTAMNERLIVSSIRQHELTEAAEKLNAQLQAEITEREKTEAALGASESLFRTLYETLPVAAFVCDREAVIQNYNRRAVELWGREPGRGVEKHCGSTKLLLPDGTELPHAQSPLVEVLRSGIPARNVEVFIERPDGGRLPVIVNFAALKNAEGEITGGVTTFMDISERKEAEEKLRESELETKRQRDYAEATLRTAPIPLLVLEDDLRVSTANDAFYKNFKVAPGETEGRLIYDLSNGQWNIPKLRELLEDILPKNNSFNDFEVTHEFEAIGRRTMLLNARRMDNEAGQPLRIVLAIEDITERKQAEEALQVAMKEIERGSRAKDDFLAALSHELRTPLTPVLMTVTELEGDPALPAEVRDQLGMMRRNIELEARLIDDLLDLTRIKNGKLRIAPVAADVHQLLQHTAEIVRGDVIGKEVRLTLQLEAALHYTTGDPTRLQQVFWNILKNAFKFTAAGGSVILSTHNDPTGMIIVRVADTGIGIRAEVLSHIFDAFEQGEITFQQRFGGLGLGLAISRAIVEMHGGEIHAESEGVGRGAIFSVTFATVDAPELLDGAQSTPPAVNRALRLLVVDDHEATLAVLTRLLTRSRHHVTPASSMREGLAAAAVGKFDAVISDLGLPDGTGFELMEKLRAAHGLRGIALSGYGMDEDVRRSQEAGFGAHLTKPIDFARLERALEDLMAGAAQKS